MLQVLHMSVCVPHLHMLEDGLQGAVQLIGILQFFPKQNTTSTLVAIYLSCQYQLLSTIENVWINGSVSVVFSGSGLI